ncbi:hypothetical protein AS593_00050 [Caulobacter vibrioides]|nr:hypothetical protein AS593_00050 [Caulobacter vibrioides]
MAQTFEDALETVQAWLEAPPPSGSPEEARFLSAIERVLAEPDGSEADAEQAAAIDDIVRVDDDLRQRLARLANAHRNPFGDHPDGIGPTLGMDLGTKKGG